MKKGKILASIGLVTSAALTLVACGQSNRTTSTNPSKFKTEVPKKAIKNGGTLRVAILSSSPFTGIFSEEISDSATDSEVAQFGSESLLHSDKNYTIDDKGAATFKLDLNKKTATIKIKDGVKWSDGKPVTAKDVEYAYEIVANKGTETSRYTESLQNIVGLTEYHDGKSKTISGVEMPDGENGKTVVLHFKEMHPGMAQIGSPYFLKTAEPYHYLKDVPFNKLKSSDKIRKNPLFFGPYKLKNIVRGESVTWVPNTHYWNGKPHVQKIVAQVVSPDSAPQAIKSNKFDIVEVSNSQWKNVKDTKDYNFVANIPLSYSYLGFKLGKWDAKAGKNIANPKAKMGNKKLRQAIAYAMNVNEVYKKLADGLTFRIPTLIPAAMGKYSDTKAKGYTYDLAKANKLLDEAGYKKKKGEKYRRTPSGKKLTIHLAAMSSSQTQESVVQNYLQQWHKIGLDVELTGGRLIEFNSFYERVQNDDKDIDMYMGAWSLAADPSQSDLYGESAPYNFARFVTKKNNQLIDAIDSSKSLDDKYRVQKAHEWQEYMLDQAFVVPVSSSYQITAVSKKFTNYSVKTGTTIGWQDIALAK